MRKAKRNIGEIIIGLLDPLLAIISTPFLHLLFRIRRRGTHTFPAYERQLLAIGIFPIIRHYAEPMFDYCDLQSLRTDRALPGIRLNLKEAVHLIGSLDYSDEFSRLICNSEKNTAGVPEFRMDNNSFRSGDSDMWYAIIRHFKPKRIIEIGSGNSTLIARLAIEKNTTEDSSYNCRHVCIEPFCAPWLERCGAEVLRDRVEKLGLGIFEQLSANDIVFIDSSHIIRPQGDVLFEYLQLLPTLKSGVIVHLHDIFTPKDYLDEWILVEKKFWNEQYLLEAFLTNNDSFRVLLPLNHLHHHAFEQLARCCVGHVRSREPGSFYIQKV